MVRRQRSRRGRGVASGSDPEICHRRQGDLGHPAVDVSDRLLPCQVEAQKGPVPLKELLVAQLGRRRAKSLRLGTVDLCCDLQLLLEPPFPPGLPELIERVVTQGATSRRDFDVGSRTGRSPAGHPQGNRSLSPTYGARMTDRRHERSSRLRRSPGRYGGRGRVRTSDPCL